MITIEFQKDYMLEDTQEGYIKVGPRIYGPARYDRKSNSWAVIGTKLKFNHAEVDGFSTAFYEE